MSTPRDPKPLSTGEKWVYGVFLGILLAAFAAEVARDFHPVKLSILFVLLWWVPLLFLHEAGHALMARVLGWGVRRVVIGVGRLVRRRVLRGVEVEIRIAPVAGFVQAYPRSERWPRLKDCLIYAAGPGSELVFAGLVAWVLGWDTLTDPTAGLGVLVLQSLAVAATAQAVINLVPSMVPDSGDPSNRRFSPSDGLGMFLAWWRDAQHYRQQAALWRQIEAGAMREPEE